MPTSHPRRWLILFVILAAECMDLLDATIVNVAAPTIHDDLGTSSTALQWIHRRVPAPGTGTSRAPCNGRSGGSSG
ncbi:MAG: hypothetical protein QOH12_741 [Solirubrobacteraceae bacterium]|jgi:hypothetical protein|nr:hypothetical protein [Solirubrobacteraceae bacterium]